MIPFHETPDDVLASKFMTPWKHLAAPARVTRRRRRRPSWAAALLSDRDRAVRFAEPIPCPSCGVLFAGLDGAHGEIDDGGPKDVLRCGKCRVLVVLDLRQGTIRAPSDAERRRWRLTFWFVVAREQEGD